MSREQEILTALAKAVSILKDVSLEMDEIDRRLQRIEQNTGPMDSIPPWMKWPDDKAAPSTGDDLNDPKVT
jgi:hypothetical protein|tara:strand:- start:57 stop:269 length:213 start_codon:yes stop_codon:yes gene_type:complete